MSFLRKKTGTVPVRPSSHSVAMENKSGATKPRPLSLMVPKKSPRRRTQSFEALEELVECGICLERLNHPKMLPCQHTFCLSCLQSHILAKYIENPNTLTLEEIRGTLKQKEVILHCPNCRKQLQLAKGFDDLEELPSNLYIDSLLKVLCDKSDKSSVTNTKETRCVNCQTVCQFNEQHCDHCRLDFCLICWPKHAQELQDKFAEFLEQISESQSVLEYKGGDLERQLEQLKESVKTTTREKLEELKGKEEEVLGEIHGLLKDGLEAEKKLTNDMEALRKNIQNFTTNRENDLKKVENYMNCHNNLSKLLLEVSLFGEINKFFDSTNYKLEDTENQLAVEDDLPSPPITFNALDSENNLLYHYKARVFTSKLIWNKCPKPAGIGIPQWAPNLIYIAATDSKTVLILNKTKNKVIGRLTHPEMLCPYGLAFCNKSKEIYVSDKWKHCIHVFTKEGNYARTLCSKGRDVGEVTSPQGLAFNHLHNLVVCDTGNDRILIIDPKSGEQISTIGLHGRTTELNMPTDVAVFQDKIIVADSGNHRVKIYDSNGKKHSEFGALGKAKGQFRCIESVSVDLLGFVVVGDSGNGRVQIFDSEGKFVRSFAGANSKMKFRWISGVYVNEELEIIVTDHKSKCLCIF